MIKAVYAMSLLLILLTGTSAQIKTVKGNYCGQNTGNRSGSFGFRVGTVVRVFEMNFGQAQGNARMVRFNFKKLRVGDEFIIKYASEGESEFIQSITGTGKRKRIAPCQVE